MRIPLAVRAEGFWILTFFVTVQVFVRDSNTCLRASPGLRLRLFFLREHHHCLLACFKGYLYFDKMLLLAFHIFAIHGFVYRITFIGQGFRKGFLICHKCFWRKCYLFAKVVQGPPILFKLLLKGLLYFVERLCWRTPILVQAFKRDSYPFMKTAQTWA